MALIHLWGCQDLLDYLSFHSTSLQSTPWLILVDFNAILSSINKCESDPSWHGHLDDFGSCGKATKLVRIFYLAWKGYYFLEARLDIWQLILILYSASYLF